MAFAPPCFRDGQPVPPPGQFWDPASGAENIVVAVADSTVSAQQLSLCSSSFDELRLYYVDLSPRARAGVLKESMSSLKVKPAALIAPNSIIAALCSTPSSVRFAVATGTDATAMDLMKRLRPTNPDLLAFALAPGTTAAQTAQSEQIAAFLRGGLESQDVWHAMYGVLNIADVEGILNLRDFGGYPTRDGKRVRRGLMYRSAEYVLLQPVRVFLPLSNAVAVSRRPPPNPCTHYTGPSGSPTSTISVPIRSWRRSRT
jgi:hypothetical protein